jgi:glycosyltransferase involved in cell wall biosynthesis
LHSNFAGFELNRVTGTPWVAHFSDPIYRSIGVKFASPLRTFITYREEEKLLRNAWGITFVNEETLQRTTQHQHSYTQKSTVIPHCFEPEYFDKLRNTISEAVIKVGYIGSLYSRRNPFEVIDAIEHVRARSAKNIELHLYGTIEEAILEQIGTDDRKWISVHGSVSYLESLKAMKAMDALLLIDMPDEISLFTPSKLIDYLAAEKYVIGITSPSSPTAKLLSEIGYPVVLPGDQERLRQEISKVLGRQHELSEQHRLVTARFRADVVSKQLSSILSRVAKSRT